MSFVNAIKRLALKQLLTTSNGRSKPFTQQLFVLHIVFLKRIGLLLPVRKVLIPISIVLVGHKRSEWSFAPHCAVLMTHSYMLQ